ncbi:transferase, partial [Salmonella enterica]|nr:transferase [Salmonella enterica]
LTKERPWFYTSLAMACYGDSTDRAELASFYKKLGYPKIATNLIFCLKGLASYTKKIKLAKMVIKKIFS